jgi:TonB family protein
MIAPLLAALAAAAQPAAVPATPHWRVDWGEPRCMLMRESSDAAPSLAIRYVPGDPRPELFIVDPRWNAGAVKDAGAVNVVLVGAGGEPVRNFEPAAVDKTGRYAIASAAVGRDFLDRFARASSVSVQKRGLEMLNVPVPGAAAALAALRQCEDDMLTKWQVDPATWHHLSAPPRPVAEEAWLRPEDYPEAALRADAPRTTVTRLEIGLDGKVAQCAVVASSGSSVLDTAACRAMRRRARFVPGVSSDGGLVRTTVIRAVTWDPDALDRPMLGRSSEGANFAAKEKAVADGHR